MVKKALSLLLLSLSIFALSAADCDFYGSLDLSGIWFNGTLTGAPSSLDASSSFDSLLLGSGKLPIDSYLDCYSGIVKAGMRVSDSAIKAEVRGAFSYYKLLSQNDVTPSLEKAYIKFRFPSFNNKKLTIAAGKAPLSWGLGTYYRIGDVLLDLKSNDKAGESVDRNIWLLSMSQSIGNGWAFDAALSMPLEEQKKAAGLTIRKTLDNDFLKSIHGFYSYSEGNVHRASLAFDISLYFDITGGVESRFRGADDYRAVINLMRQYSIESETSSCTIGLYLSSELDFYESEYNIFSALSIAPTDRISIYLALTNKFKDDGYRGLLTNANISFLAVDGVKINIGGIYSYNNKIEKHSFGCFVALESSF